MNRLIPLIQLILCATLLSACTSTHHNSTVISPRQSISYSEISGWGSSIDPAETQGRGGYANSVFYY